MRAIARTGNDDFNLPEDLIKSLKFSPNLEPTDKISYSGVEKVRPDLGNGCLDLHLLMLPFQFKNDCQIH